MENSNSISEFLLIYYTYLKRNGMYFPPVQLQIALNTDLDLKKVNKIEMRNSNLESAFYFHLCKICSFKA